MYLIPKSMLPPSQGSLGMGSGSYPQNSRQVRPEVRLIPWTLPRPGFRTGVSGAIMLGYKPIGVPSF